MKKYLLPKEGKFYKANLHCHTTVSDGSFSPEKIKEIYKEQGYSIIAYTDHDVLIPHPELADEEFLPLNGYEIEINQRELPWEYKKTCHMCLIALKPDNLKQVCYHRSEYFIGNGKDYTDQVQFDENEPDFIRDHNPECINKVIEEGRKNGFFVTYNHPSWSSENYSDYINYHNMNAMEIFNFSCHTMGYCDYNEKEYDDILRGGERIFCIAADDNHNKKPMGTRGFDSFGGFTMIKADKLDYTTITDALVAGNFYASHGPLIHDLWYEDGEIHITCSEADRIVLNTGKRRTGIKCKENDEALVEASFEVYPEDIYVRITVTDEKGNHANTNAYFTDELCK